MIIGALIAGAIFAKLFEELINQGETQEERRERKYLACEKEVNKSHPFMHALLGGMVTGFILSLRDKN